MSSCSFYIVKVNLKQIKISILGACYSQVKAMLKEVRLMLFGQRLYNFTENNNNLDVELWPDRQRFDKVSQGKAK